METAWILREPLEMTDSQDHPYLESARGRLGHHEVAMHLAGDWHAQNHYPEFRVFLDGAQIFEWGDASPSQAWFLLCRELGYVPDQHWDWDPALILFQQVLPALARDWHEIPLPYGSDGVPDGVICLATLRRSLAERVAKLEHMNSSPTEALLAEMFKQLPLRAVILHDDPQRRVDYVGNSQDAPYMGEFLYLGERRESAAVLSKVTLASTGGMRWSPWLPGGNWNQEGREFAASMGALHFLRAAGLPDEMPAGFAEAFKRTLDSLSAFLEPLAESYRETYPGGIPWHRDPKNRYVNHMVVEARIEDGQTVLVFDDGSEVVVAEHREALAPLAQDMAQEVWGV